MTDQEIVRGTQAHELENRIIEIKKGVNQSVWDLAEILCTIHNNQYYKELGYESFETWIRCPEIDLAPATASTYMNLYREYVLKHNIQPAELAGIDYTKLYDMIPAVSNKSEDEVKEWVEKARTLRRVDLKREIQVVKASEQHEEYKKSIEGQVVDTSVTIALSDPIKGLEQGQEESVDAIITCPPEDDTSWVAPACKLIKLNGSIFVIGNYKNIFDLYAVFTYNGMSLVRDIVWYHKTPSSAPNLNHLMHNHKVILWFHKDVDFTSNLLDFTSDVIEYDDKPKTKHPLDVPEKVVADIMALGTNPDDLIVDPFSGGGTVAVVGKKLGRKVMALEQDSTWLELSTARLNKVK